MPVVRHIGFPRITAAIIVYFSIYTPTFARSAPDNAPTLQIIAKLADRNAAESLYQQTLLAKEYAQVRLVQGPLTIRTISIGVFGDEGEAKRAIAQLQSAEMTAELRATTLPPGFIVDVISAFDDKSFDDTFERVRNLGFQTRILVTTASLDDDLFFVMGALRPAPAVEVAEPLTVAQAPVENAPAPTPVITPRKKEFSWWQWLRTRNPLALHTLAAQGEFDQWSINGAAASGSYFSTDLALLWRWSDAFAVYFGGRADMYEQTSTHTFQQLTTDYDSTFLRWTQDGHQVTVGQQKLIFGGDDRDSLSNRLSVVDLSRKTIETSVQRKTWPSLAARWEYDYEGAHLDLAGVPYFTGAKLPSYTSMWSPIDTTNGRIVNRRTPSALADLIKNSEIGEHHAAYGGAGFQVSYRESDIRHALAIQYVVDPEPYFAVAAAAGEVLRAGGTTAAALAASQNQAIIASHPEMWILTYSESFRSWRFDLAMIDNFPVTTTAYRTQGAQALEWLFGADFTTPDPGTALYLALEGRRLGTQDAVLDRTQLTRLRGNVKKIFAEYPWRMELAFYAGLDTYEFHIAPAITYTGTRQFEVAIGAHYFYGDNNTEAGFHRGQNLLTLGWQTRF